MKINKVLITGGAGYVGSVLTDVLLSNSYHVRVFDPVSEAEFHPMPFLNHKKFELMQGDIRDPRAVRKAIKGVDAIIHLAAVVGYPACEKEPKLSHDINVNGTKTVVDVVNGSLPIFFASTTSVYGKIDDDVCTEETKRNPLSRYGKQKAKAEDIIRKNGEFVIFRFTTGFGVSYKMRFDNLPNDFTYKAIKEKKIIVYQKNYIRSFIHVRDIAKVFLFGIENYKNMKGEVFNVGNNDLNISKEELTIMIQKKTNCEIEFKEIGKDLEERNYFTSFDKITSKGYSTEISLSKGIDELIRTMKVL